MLAKPTPSLAELIKRRIAAEGPISLYDYMQACLATPASGYYIARQPIGAGGDFITAPEVSQIFGELLGLWAARVWQSMGEPDDAMLAELGPGRGTLMADALRAAKTVPQFSQSISVALVEISPMLRETQVDTLQDCGVALAWCGSVEQLRDKPLLLLANEFLDALPIRQFVRREDGWHERYVGVERDALVFVDSHAISDLDLPDASPGDILEKRPGVSQLMAALAARKAPLAALFIDYGHTAPGFGDTFQAVRRHDFADPLVAPGEADLTAHVDFADLAHQARAAGLTVFGPLTQGEFLLRLGLDIRGNKLLEQANPDQRQAIIAGAHRLADPKAMGELFKVIAVTNGTIAAPPPFLGTV
jgi:NADH dehydrogenase [ubiquinone] 1 alpha subcomplex assembly factor 7